MGGGSGLVFRTSKGLCVLASEEKMVLEERVKWAESELREARAELRKMKMEVVALREGWDDESLVLYQKDST